MQSYVAIQGLKIYGYHGVLPEEKIIGTYYLVDLKVKADISAATQSDHLEDTINYAILNDIVHQEFAIPSQLMERVAGRIMDQIERQFPSIEEIFIKITKTSPPMPGEMVGASVEFHKTC